MKTSILAATGGGVAAAAAEAADVLRGGGVVGVPTETVYGLACDARQPSAAAAVFAVKERPAFDPLIVHVAGAEWIARWSAAEGAVLGMAQRLAENFWPGPLTLVLPAREDVVPDLVRSGLPTVALRCSAHPVMAAVVAASGGPVAAPSANRFGRISPVTAAHVLEELGGRIPLVLDGGPCCHGLESTIVAVEASRLVLLRPGPVTVEALGEFAAVGRPMAGVRVEAPGMLESHYAPRTPLRILPEGSPVPEDAFTSGLLAFGAGTGGYATVECLPADPLAAAPDFFAALRRLDSCGLRCIYAQAVPESGLGMAIMDRLRRAAHD